MFCRAQPGWARWAAWAWGFDDVECMLVQSLDGTMPNVLWLGTWCVMTGTYFWRNFRFRSVTRPEPSTCITYWSNWRISTPIPVLSHLVGFGRLVLDSDKVANNKWREFSGVFRQTLCHSHMSVTKSFLPGQQSFLPGGVWHVATWVYLYEILYWVPKEALSRWQPGVFVRCVTVPGTVVLPFGMHQCLGPHCYLYSTWSNV